MRVPFASLRERGFCPALALVHPWVPAFAGMTVVVTLCPSLVVGFYEG